ncbi:hypothetical protein ABZP36_024117 [Zizania latifolia]
MSLEKFKDEVSKVFHVDVTDVSLKYFLPNNNKTLITISCDQDLQRMVDFTASSAQVDVFLISRVENRASKNNKKALSATVTAIQANANHVKQPRQAVTENGDSRAFQLEFVSDFAFATPARAASTAPDILNLQKLALVDNTTSELVELFDDAINPFGSEITTEPTQGVNNPIVFWDDIIKGGGQEFDNVKDFRAQLCKYAIGKGFVYRFIKNETTRVTVKCVGEEHWSDAIFRGCHYDHFSLNIVDAFNNWIPTKKEGSIVLMIDSLRMKTMEVIEARRESCKSWSGPLTPLMKFKAQDEMSKDGKLTVLCSSETVFKNRELPFDLLRNNLPNS